MNEKFFYDLLFNATAKAIKDWFKHKHNIIPGIVSVLHTSGSDLKYHPHIHMIVTGGGLNIDDKIISQLPGDYLTRQRFLASKFKQFFFIELFRNVNANKLRLPCRFKQLNDNQIFFKWARDIRDKHWIVSIQKPLHNIQHIVAYVGRYTKRACLSEYKIVQVDQHKVKIIYNDYKNTPKNQKPLQSIKAFNINEFFDQLLQHVPLEKFKMVRYFGIYTSHYKKLINPEEKQIQSEKHKLNDQWEDFHLYRKLEKQNGNPDPLICPNCNIKIAFDKIIFANKFFIDDS